MKKSKLITMAVAFLLTIGMIGAGFAAWVISAPTQESVQGTVSVDTVVDKRIKLSTPVTTNAGIAFGAPNNTTAASNAWLTWDSSAVKEDVVSDISFKRAVFGANPQKTVNRISPREWPVKAGCICCIKA